MMEIFDTVDIRNPMLDFKEEAIKIESNTKKKIENSMNQTEILKYVFENMDEKRLLLSKTLVMLEEFYSIYEKYKVDEYNVRIGEICIDIPKLLWCMRLSSKSNGGFSLYSLLRTKRYLDAINKNKQVCDCCGYELIDESHLEQVNIENESNITKQPVKEEDEF